MQVLCNIFFYFWCFSATFYNIFSYIMTTSFSGGGSRSTQREPPTMGKQLVNFITCGFESSAPFFVIYKAMLLCNSYTCQLYNCFCFRTEVEMSGIAVSKYSTKKAFDKSSSFINICITRYTCVYGGSVNEKPSHQ